MGQSTFGSFDSNDDPDDEIPDDIDSGSISILAPEEKRGGEGCCPWCLGSTDYFEDNEFGTACTTCGTMVPVHMDWHQRGEKIVI